MTKNTGLNDLTCFGNQLTAEGLNALFGMLPNNADGRKIYISGNPGADGCDWRIATAKGWKVR